MVRVDGATPATFQRGIAAVAIYINYIRPHDNVGAGVMNIGAWRTAERASRSDRPRTTPNGIPKDQTRGHKADGEKVRHGRGHYYDLYSIGDYDEASLPF